MRLRVLGCYGGSAPGMRPSSFLLDDTIAFDMGALTQQLPIEEQARVGHVFLTHAHLDHVATLPFLADNLFPLVDEPVRVHGPEAAMRCLSEHVLNGSLWPDFTTISNGRTTILALEALRPGQAVVIGDLTVTAFEMEHTVECLGYLIQGPESAIAICGDTRTTTGLAGILSHASNLKAVFLEVSFPNHAAEVAEVSRHLTTAGFGEQAACVPADVDIHVMHMKPEYVEDIRAELAALDLPNVTLTEQDREYVF